MRTLHHLGLVVLPLLAAACSTTTTRVSLGTVSGSFPLPDPAAALRVELDAGSIRVRPHAGTDIGVEAEVLCAKGRAAALRDRPLALADHLAALDGDGLLTIRSSHLGATDASDWELRVTLLVPGARALGLALKAGNVDVELDELRGLELDLTAGNAGVAVARLTGPARARLSNGQLTVEASEAVGPIAAAVTAGNVRLGLPRGQRYALDLSTQAGSIDVDSAFDAKPVRDYAASRLAQTVGPADAGEPIAIQARVNAGTIDID
ncbi:MAG: DUF4097 family beta strand repeat protein [Planctomycetes bacterium]|nr:DUF4097 family beta strand repeat protein [Planctomycetota bacterium]